MDGFGMSGSYKGFPDSPHFSSTSRQLGQATGVLRSFVMTSIVSDNKNEIDRITKYYLFWNFYEGRHYRDFNDGMLSFNYVRSFIDTVNMFLLGSEAFTFQVKSHYTSQVPKELEKPCEELIMYHWNKSDKLQLSHEILQMGSVTGDCWVGINWQEEEKFCRIEVFDSRQCFPTFENGNYNKMDSFLVRQPLNSWQNEMVDPNRAPRQSYMLFVMRYTKESIETWYQKDVSLDVDRVQKYEYTRMDNPYGFIPVVHIKNKPNAAGYFGKSDANDILKVNKVYNELMQQLKAVIDYHVAPTTVITGANAKSLKKGLGQIWSGLPAEANVFNLGLDVDLSATTTYIKDLKTAMHELSDVPENALGKIQAISNTSAAALQITYHPLMRQANLKAITYGEGIEKINSMILKILEKRDPSNERLRAIKKLNKNFLTEMSIEPVFAYGFPKDRTDMLNSAQMELNMKIGSRKEIMERMNKQNVDDLLKEIDDDTIHQNLLAEEAMTMINQSLGGGGIAAEGAPSEEEEEIVDVPNPEDKEAEEFAR